MQRQRLPSSPSRISASLGLAFSFSKSIDLLNDNPHPTEQEIREGLEGNLCRCTGYHNIVKAVQAAAAGGAQ